MESDFIKYHPESNTYIVKKKAFFEDEVCIKGDLITGPGVNFWKDLHVTGSLKLGKGSTVKGDVIADNALIGPCSRIDGRLEIKTSVKILDGVVVHSVICGGEMSVRPRCYIGFAKADITLELIGNVDVKEIERGTRVIVRTDGW
ncbi:MAG: polymer-forming cytoskeletal protein [Methanohalobium sp.]|uniref:polymer-forming cytoskeletal protein n=1 Tax=Methanohalobium sp. TaxID=2837493 RepID=UPI0039795ED2